MTLLFPNPQNPSTPEVQQSSAELPVSPLALAVSGLSFAYPDGTDVLEQIAFDVMVGERVGVLGPNGAGKTTLFKMICGLLRPTEGEMCLFDQLIETGCFRSDLGFVFQNPNDQLFSASVWEDIAFGPQNMGLPPDAVDRCVANALTLTGTQSLTQRLPHHLSGGEKRMVAIATVVAMNPRLIIYDEPSANLDLRARRRLIQYLQDSEETIMVASHDLEMILEVCDRVFLIDHGHIVADGDPKEIMKERTLMESHGLEVPYSLGST
ncbi:MAG: energy-coupling factor ABC transporter ATP-binding protein [Cyanobacteria bacterium P01_A01_bin.17]